MSNYFSNASATRRDGTVGRYLTMNDLVTVVGGDGVRMQVVLGEALMLSYVTMDAHAVAPVHAHDEEQIGLIVSGTVTFTLDGIQRQLVPNDIYVAPGGVPHGAQAGAEGCVIADLFTPPRAALVEMLTHQPDDSDRDTQPSDRDHA